jgi:perosamine synthetase
VVTNNDDMARAIDSLRNQGRDDAATWMNHVRLGYNYRLDEMSAALGLSQASRLDAILDARNNVARMYTERLQDVPGVTVPEVLPETTRMSWFVYVIKLDERLDKAEVMAQLEQRGVPSRPYFSPIHTQPLYRERFGFTEGDFPVTEEIAKRTLAIPFYSMMPEDEVEYVSEQIREVVAGMDSHG